MTTESEVPTRTELAQRHFRAEYGHFIGGQWVQGNSGRTIPVSNPTDGTLLSTIQAGDAVDVNRAVAAAKAAFITWSRSHPMQRQAVLAEMARRLTARSNDFAMMETLDNGKPIRDSAGFDMPARRPCTTTTRRRHSTCAARPWTSRTPSPSSTESLSACARRSFRGTLTGLMDRAERRGLARRSAVPGDRRALRVALTEAGHQAAVAFHAEMTAELDQLTAPLAPQDREHFRATMAEIVTRRQTSSVTSADQ